MTLTMEPDASSTARMRVVEPSGACTEVIGSRPKPSKTRGKPSASSASWKRVNRREVCSGTTASMVASTRESAMAAASAGGAAGRTEPATNHTRTPAAASTAAIPPTASSRPIALAERRGRSLRPTATSRACPIAAQRKTTATTTTARRASLASRADHRARSVGSASMARAPPPRKPPSESTETTSPCRNPDHA